jgi:hypothetical protein
MNDIKIDTYRVAHPLRGMVKTSTDPFADWVLLSDHEKIVAELQSDLKMQKKLAKERAEYIIELCEMHNIPLGSY